MLLEAVGFSLQIQSTDVDETPLAGELPADMVMRLAKMKASAAIPPAYPCIVIAADTTVALDQQSLGKPENDTNGYAMLRSLSGRTHDVFTGFCVRLLRSQDDLTPRPLPKILHFFIQKPCVPASAFAIYQMQRSMLICVWASTLTKRVDMASKVVAVRSSIKSWVVIQM